MQYTSAEEVMNEINTVTPSYAGITYSRIEENGLQWPCPSTEHPGTKYLHKINLVRGLGLFSAIEYRHQRKFRIRNTRSSSRPGVSSTTSTRQP